MGNNISKEVKDALENRDLKRLRNIFNSEEGKKFDPYQIIFKADGIEDSYDCISYLLRYCASSSTIQFLQLFKEQIEKVKNNNKNKTFAPIPQTRSYLCNLLSNPCDLEGFKFLLDNESIFAGPPPSDPNVPSNFFNELCRNDTSIELLREYLSSGRVEERFKNSNGGGNKAMHNEQSETPIETACRALNAEAVLELASARIGGFNWDDCVKRMMQSLDHWDYSGLNAEEKEARAVKIVLTILSQPGAADAIRTLRLHQKTDALFPEHFTPVNLEFTEGGGEKKHTQDSFYNLLKIKFDLAQKSYLSRRSYTAQLSEASVATVALWNGKLDKLYQTFVSNGCEQHPLVDGASHELNVACEKGDVETVKKILVEHEFHKCLISVERGTSHLMMGDGSEKGKKPLHNPLTLAAGNGHTEIVEMLLAAYANPDANKKLEFDSSIRDEEYLPVLTPLTAAASKNNHNKIVELLLDAGADIDFTAKGDKYKKTALHLSCENPDGEEITKLLLQRGADVNARMRHLNDEDPVTPLDVLIMKGCQSDDDGNKYDSRIKMLSDRDETKLDDSAYFAVDPRRFLTPLHIAIEHQYTAAVQIIVSAMKARGMKDYCKNANGQTAVELAKQKVKGSVFGPTSSDEATQKAESILKIVYELEK